MTPTEQLHRCRARTRKRHLPKPRPERAYDGSRLLVINSLAALVLLIGVAL